MRLVMATSGEWVCGANALISRKFSFVAGRGGESVNSGHPSIGLRQNTCGTAKPQAQPLRKVPHHRRRAGRARMDLAAAYP
jgi:hypothetical protein